MNSLSAKIKRLLDVFVSILGIIITLPLFPIIALLIKLDSKGPVFYLCDRIGKDLKPFRMYKFRTMIETPVCVGASVCPQGDVRVTSFGRFLRRTKLNELPQLVNILKGEMSLVGPRPEAPDLAELYPPEAEELFSVKPGLVGPSQIVNRNEEELYPEGVDPKGYYIDYILPGKLHLDLEYVKRPTLLNYLKYILLALKATILGALSRRHFFENRSQIYLFLFDLTFVFASYSFAVLLRFEGLVPSQEWPLLLRTFPLLFSFRLVCFISFGLYRSLIRYLNLYNYLTIVKAATLSTILTIVTVYLFDYRSFPRSILIIDWFCVNTFMILIRIPSKMIRDKFYQKESDSKKRVLIYGAGDKGNLAVTHLKDRANIVGFLDDDPLKRHRKIQQFSVMGGRYDIESLSQIYLIEEVVITISDLDDRNLDHIISLCHKASVEYSIFTTVVDSYLDRTRQQYIRTKKIAHWADCQDFKIDLASVGEQFFNKRILLIGPSSALGLELLKYLAPLNTREIIILDRYESYLNETLMQALAFMQDVKVSAFLSSDPLPKAVEGIMSDNDSPDIILHLGTRKYHTSMQLDPLLLAQENILNTWDLLEMMKRTENQLFLMASSIGATNPANFVQATLRLAEYYLMYRHADLRGNNVVVRLLNLLQNRGCVLNRIQKQLRAGSKIVLNHPEERRYFFTADSAAKFILVSASNALAQREAGTAIYMPTLNGKAKISDLARLIIQDHGLDPDRDVEIEYIFTENLAEWQDQVQLDDGDVQETPHENIMRIIPHIHLSDTQMLDDIENIRTLIEDEDREGLIRMVESKIQLLTGREYSLQESKVRRFLPILNYKDLT